MDARSAAAPPATEPSTPGPSATGPGPAEAAAGAREPAAGEPAAGEPGAARIALTPAPWRWVALIAAVAFGLELAVSARYGYHRDELYFLEAGKHPAFGYVDQPPLVPLLAHLDALVTGNSLVGLRVVPALVLAAMVAMTAIMSRLCGAGRTGQVLAALGTATCLEYLGAMHLFSTTMPDFFFWTLVLLMVLRLLTGGDRRWWLAIGVTSGVAAEGKWDIGFLLIFLAIGFALTPARRLARSWWLVAGAVAAAALTVPDLIWQAQHGWAEFAVLSSLNGSAGANRAAYWPTQIIYTSLVLAPVAVAGLIWFLRRPAARPFRPVGIATLIALVLFFVLGGKPYYPGAVYTVLFAGGSVPLERWLTARRDRRQAAGDSRRTGARLWPAGLWPAGLGFGALMILVILPGLPVALPLLPAATLRTVPLQKINYDLGETIGWPRLVHLVAREYHALPPAVRARTVILTSNYGEAGAIDRYGAADGLPQAYSGHNNFWWWGPPPARDTNALVVGVGRQLLEREFGSVRPLTRFHNGLGVQDDEQGVQLYLATGLRTSRARAWIHFRMYG